MSGNSVRFAGTTFIVHGYLPGILKRSAPPRPAVCAPLLGSIAKKEEELKIQNLLLTQAKDEVISRLITGERVFTEGKRSRIPVTPRMDQRSPPTSLPAS